MTIDEAIEVFQDDKSETILNLSELRSDELAKWLTELKAYRGYKDLYEQGRADKYQEITSEYMLFTPKQVADIREDAINEFVKLLNNESYHEDCYRDYPSSNMVVVWEDILKVAEQLKESKNA